MQNFYDMHMHCNFETDSDINKKIYLNFINNVKSPINKGIVCINPFVEEIQCQNHYTSIKQVKDNMLAKCNECGKELYLGDDLYFKYNEELIRFFSNNPNYYPFVLLPILNTKTFKLIKFYEEKFGNKIKGYKLYTGVSDEKLNDIVFFDGDLPLIIHTGYFENQHPKNMLDFIKNYSGNISLAHFARLDYESLSKLSLLENVYYDISPSAYMYKRYILEKHKGGFLCDKNEINSVSDIYKKLINSVDINKILWGSDIPFSTQDVEYRTFIESDLPEKTKLKILSKNPERYLKL